MNKIICSCVKFKKVIKFCLKFCFDSKYNGFNQLISELLKSNFMLIHFYIVTCS